MTKDGATVIIVEDDELLGAYVALVLVEHGFNVLGPAMNVLDAMSILKEKRPDAAVLDYKLSAEETSEPVLALLDKWNVPLCVISGSLREELPAEFIKHPVLQKPFAPEDLFDIVDAL